LDSLVKKVILYFGFSQKNTQKTIPANI
jgi:hypothetical protein